MNFLSLGVEHSPSLGFLDGERTRLFLAWIMEEDEKKQMEFFPFG